MLSLKQRILKRILDIFISLIGIIIFIIPIFILVILSTIINKEFGIFTQKRIGINANPFFILKIKSMKIGNEKNITPFGKFIRKTKLDELPQLFNVFIGKMSIVGPRPDIEGYADKLEGNNRKILNVKPGITSEATILFRNEDEILSNQKDPVNYNDNVLWPQKVKLNIQYVENYSIINDFKIILKTLKLIFI